MIAFSLLTRGSLPSEVNAASKSEMSLSTAASVLSLPVPSTSTRTSTPMMDMKHSYQIRKAEDQGDLEGICELENLLFENSFGPGTVSREMLASYVVVARTDDPHVAYGVAGYAIFRPGPMGDLLRLGVHPRARGQGLGTELLEHVLRLFPGPAMLLVRKDNEDAFRIYRKAGFEVTGKTDESWVMLRATSSAA